MNPRRTATILFAATLAAGCGKSPSEKDVADALVSWVATADMAGQAWLNHTTFDKYTMRTLTTSSDQLNQQLDELTKVAANHPPSVDSAIGRARTSISQMSGFVAANDAPGFQSALDSLRAAKKIVMSYSDSLDKSP